MSRETVIALRRFTEKLAAEDELVLPDPAGEKSDVKPTPRGVSPGVGTSGKPLVPNITTPPKAYKTPPVETPAATPSWWEENVAPLMANAGSFLGQNGLPIAAGVGLGGLGAYGLSRLFGSKKKNEEESSFPWLSTLLGMGGGGALAAYLANPANRQSAMQTYNRYTPLPTQTVKNDRAAEAAAGEEPFTTESLGDNPAMRAARG